MIILTGLQGDLIALALSVSALVAVTIPDAYLWNAVRDHEGKEKARYETIQKWYWIICLILGLAAAVIYAIWLKGHPDAVLVCHF